MATSQETTLRRLLSRPSPRSRQRFLLELEEEPQSEILFLLLHHIDLHVAEGHRSAAGVLLRLLEELIPVLEPTFEVLLNISRGQLHARQGDPAGTLECYKQALRLLERHDYDGEELPALLLEIGILQDQLGQQEKALVSFRRAAHHSRQHDLPYNRAAALFNMASIFLEQGDSQRFQRYSKRVESLERTHGLMSLRARRELLTATWHERSERQQVALEHYHRALDGYRAVHDRLKASEILEHLGTLALEHGPQDAAGSLLGEALAERRALDAREAEARFYLARGTCAWHSGLVEEAAWHFREALVRYRGLDSEACTALHYRLYLCDTALGRTQLRLLDFMEGAARSTEGLPGGAPDPGVGYPSPPRTLAAGPPCVADAYRVLRGDGGILESFSLRYTERSFRVGRTELQRLLVSLTHWLKQAGRRDLARHLQRESGAVGRTAQRRARLKPARKPPQPPDH